MLVGDDDDAVANLVERRWFAASKAVTEMHGDCEVLREVRDLADEAWRHARAQLADLETLRDALAERLAEREGLLERAPQPADRVTLSAAWFCRPNVVAVRHAESTWRDSINLVANASTAGTSAYRECSAALIRLRSPDR
jgi:hypothetical protein